MSQSPDVRTLIEAINRRLDRLEKHAGLGAMVNEAPAVASPSMARSETLVGFVTAKPESPSMVRHSVPAFPTAAPPTAPTVDGAPPAKWDRAKNFLHRGAEGEAPPFSGPIKGSTFGFKRAAESGTGGEPFSVERLIGAKFFAVAGALIVTVGVGYFLKLAYDRGWFAMPPTGKCVVAALFGVALLAAGEIVRRRVNAWASSGLSSAGVATLMASVYGAYAMYQLIGASTAFVLLVAAAVAGGAVAWMSRLPAVAAVSMVGAYFAPVLVRSDSPHPLVLPLYLTVLLALGLWMAWRLVPVSRGFAAVRHIAWYGTAILGSLWCVMMGADNPLIAVAFLVAVPILVHAEVILTARRLDASLPDEREGTDSEALDPRIARAFALAGVPRLLVGSIAANAWGIGFATIVFRHNWPGLDWLPAAAGMSACGALAVALAGHLRSLRDRPRTALAALGAVLAGQSAGLLIVVVSLALSGWTQALAWLGMGVGACIAGRWVRTWTIEGYGVLLLVLGTARIVLESAWAFMNGTPTALVGGAFGGGAVLLSAQAVMIALSGVAWMASAQVLVSGGARPRPVGVIGAFIGLGLMMLSVPALLNTMNSAWIAPVWLVICVAAAAAARAERRLGLDAAALCGLILCGAAWSLRWADSYGAWQAMPLAHPGLWTALAIGGAFALVSRRFITCTADPAVLANIRAGVWTVAGVLGFAATSMEVSRSAALLAADPSIRGAALSVYWSAFALGMVVLGFVRRVPVLRRIGLGVMGVAAAKVLVFDLSGVGQVWRVLSTVGVGLLMIATAIVYSKVAMRLDRQRTAGATDGVPTE